MYEQEVIQVANPASVYCQEQGGKIEIRETAEGQEGWCVFIDDRECDEWEFFRSQKCD
jgi:putative hemolysin